MSKVADINDHLELTSSKTKAFPTDVDVARWNNLSDDEKMAIVDRDEEAGFQSGVAPAETPEKMIARVRTRR